MLLITALLGVASSSGSKTPYWFSHFSDFSFLWRFSFLWQSLYCQRAPRFISFLSSFIFSLSPFLSYTTFTYSHGFNNCPHNTLRNTHPYVSSGQTSSWALFIYFCLASEHIYLWIPHIKHVRNWDLINFLPKPVLSWQCLQFLKPEI